MIIHSAQVVSSQCVKTTMADGNNLVILSGIAITPSLIGDKNWVRGDLYIDDIGPQWLRPPNQDNIVAMAFLNSIYKGNLDESDDPKKKDQHPDRADRAGWAIDNIIGTDIKNQRICLKVKVAVYHPRVSLLRIGFYITAVGKLLDGCENLIVENIYPSDNSIDTSKNTSIIITFNMPIDKTTFKSAFKLEKEKSGESINGQIESLNDKTIVFVPQKVLDSDTRYFATIAKEIKNIRQSLGLKSDKTWSFRTSKE